MPVTGLGQRSAMGLESCDLNGFSVPNLGFFFYFSLQLTSMWEIGVNSVGNGREPTESRSC
jgi:hypothetical protein